MLEVRHDGPGSQTWVREQLLVLRDDPLWAQRRECAQLVDWLHTVVHHRARKLGLGPDLSDELAQDAMTRVFRSLATSRDSFATADNPAAVLERVTARAVGESRHRIKMCGFGGVAPNGLNWRARYPRQIGGDAAQRIFDELPATANETDPAVADAAERVTVWVQTNLQVQLTDDAKHALVYVLDRLVSGVSRSTLVRGAHSGLGGDPAMRHLGFDPAAASAFAVWLLGRRDSHHNAPSVLDAALDGATTDELGFGRWQRDGLRVGFVVAMPAGTGLPAQQCVQRSA